MDRITTMEAFVRVVDAGSFAEAARQWGRSKAAVSKYVGQLEAHLGLRLLRRTTRSLGLTDAGRSHYERCQQLLALLEESEAQLRAGHRALRGPLRVSAPPAFVSLHWRALTVGFLEQHPEVQLELDVTQRLVDLAEERVDVALRLTRPDDSSLVARRLAPAPLVLAAAPTYLSERGTPETPTDLRAHDCVVDTNMRFHRRWPFRHGGKKLTVEVRAKVLTNFAMVVRDLTLEGLGIGLMTRMLATEALAAGHLVEVLEGRLAAEWSVYAVTSQRRHQPARARAFIEHVRGHLEARGRGGAALL